MLRRIRPFKHLWPTEKRNCEENNGVLGRQRTRPLVRSRSGEPSGSVTPEAIRPRSLVGKSGRSYSAICRLHRDKEISDLDKQGAVARLALLDRGWREVLPNDQVRDLARQSLDKYSLRAADSLQLAASLIWCEERPSRRNFICGNHRLALAADSAGFSVLEP